MDQSPVLLTMTQLAERVGLTRRTIFNQLKADRFPIKPVEGLTPRRWNAAEVEAWLNRAA